MHNKYYIFSTSIYANNPEYESPEIIEQILLPKGYKREVVKHNSYEAWLRKLPLKPQGTPVLLYNNKLKSNQNAHYAVIKMSVGKKDLQQCADAVMRLRSEYFFSIKNYKKIKFNITSGHSIPFIKWAQGYRFSVSGNKIKWIKNSKIDYSHSNLLKYLEMVFNYAGTASLSREMNRITNIKDLKIGDVFIQGGFPGHVVIVVDMAVDSEKGSKIFLLAQSFMPAQEIHVLKNPMSKKMSPWYSTDFKEVLVTPEWTFIKEDIKRF